MPFKKVTEFLRVKDFEKLRKDINPGQQEAFRYFKLCDLEFTRFAYQIVMDEAHRQLMNVISCATLCMPRRRYSQQMTEKRSETDLKEATNFRTLFEQLKGKHETNYMSKAKLKEVRQTFK